EPGQGVTDDTDLDVRSRVQGGAQLLTDNRRRCHPARRSGAASTLRQHHPRPGQDGPGYPITPIEPMAGHHGTDEVTIPQLEPAQEGRQRSPAARSKAMCSLVPFTAAYSSFSSRPAQANASPVSSKPSSEGAPERPRPRCRAGTVTSVR